MKKVILGSALMLAAFTIQAQTKETAADPHAGHNHGTVATTKTSTTTAPVATTTAPVVKAPETLKIEESHDFGKIPQGKPVTYDFLVSNTGNSALKINNVQASCGCTTPSWDKDSAIEPGASSKITVGYNAQAEGPFTKNITITYNDNVSKIITIKGEVWKTPAASAPENKAAEIKN
ncbi:MAG: DUF1573 domain-containing protein [Chitinophagaceae bacterium]|nr:MAG: DUF1573 domain-containing protein [Chitinophagaceae bacterium]